MAYLKSSLLRNLSRNTSFRNEHFSFSRGYVFLSHSSKDIELLSGAIAFLEIYGAKVYVDERDSRMPKPPSVETAKLLKANIRASSKFIVLMSEISASSKWIPWELGLADNLIKTQNIALLPSSESGLEEYWATQEYLSLYSRIQINQSGNYVVYDRESEKQIELGQWLKAGTQERVLNG